jgi:hypothetical protein
MFSPKVGVHGFPQFDPSEFKTQLIALAPVKIWATRHEWLAIFGICGFDHEFTKS